MKTLRNLITAVLLVCSFAYSGISIVTGPTIVSDDADGNMSFSGVAVQAGDVVVLPAAPNKDKTDNLLSLQWSGSEGSGIVTNENTLPMVGIQAFYKVELVLQPET